MVHRAVDFAFIESSSDGNRVLID
jgi:hypothetical protein